MSSPRRARVEQQIRREIAAVLLSGELRDPALFDASLTVTAVTIVPDLSVARVFVDVMRDEGRARVLAALKSAAGTIRGKITARLPIKRVPVLQFELDASIERGAAIEKIVAELRAEGSMGEAAPAPGTVPAPAPAGPAPAKFEPGKRRP